MTGIRFQFTVLDFILNASKTLWPRKSSKGSNPVSCDLNVIHPFDSLKVLRSQFSCQNNTGNISLRIQWLDLLFFFQTIEAISELSSFSMKWRTRYLYSSLIIEYWNISRPLWMWRFVYFFCCCWTASPKYFGPVFSLFLFVSSFLFLFYISG